MKTTFKIAAILIAIVLVSCGGSSDSTFERPTGTAKALKVSSVVNQKSMSSMVNKSETIVDSTDNFAVEGIIDNGFAMQVWAFSMNEDSTKFWPMTTSKLENWDFRTFSRNSSQLIMAQNKTYYFSKENIVTFRNTADPSTRYNDIEAMYAGINGETEDMVFNADYFVISPKSAGVYGSYKSVSSYLSNEISTDSPLPSDIASYTAVPDAYYDISRQVIVYTTHVTEPCFLKGELNESMEYSLNIVSKYGNTDEAVNKVVDDLKKLAIFSGYIYVRPLNTTGYTINTSKQIEISISQFLNTEAAVNITIDFDKIIKAHTTVTDDDTNVSTDHFFTDTVLYNICKNLYVYPSAVYVPEINDVPYGANLVLNPDMFQ